jgi:hypothetical protein
MQWPGAAAGRNRYIEFTSRLIGNFIADLGLFRRSVNRPHYDTSLLLRRNLFVWHLSLDPYRSRCRRVECRELTSCPTLGFTDATRNHALSLSLFSLSQNFNFFCHHGKQDRLCGLVVRSSGFDSRRFQIF